MSEETHNESPLWYKDAVVYQVHVKSFFDANGDGIGDFRGLAQKLDYICELGVTALWLLPFYPSPLRDDGYDISDYRGIHSNYGSLRDFRRLVRACHSRGLRVITELVINHTSDQHPWFQKARKAKSGSSRRNFYVWSENDQKYKGTRIIFVDTERSNWTWDPESQAYYWHRFYSHQPDLNYDNPRVLREMINVLRYWMRIGVDGMRLDAVPYLVEREGTNNENLPETHTILKAFRAELDKEFPDRMLLAEANQWPEDVQPYFGNGDECHMAFHFPLMPRLYMALAQEDRHPITDILRQTPSIPDNCQWAIFLRNHDELTLEMVTDRERDYLWDFYAADRRMRINLGIRRRLAPLLNNDRRKIQLMNGLLFSMPGTPILYYGDEIGMGDNIFLGDRDGVRTPMQWSPDRNGGFSRAEPAELYLPPVMNSIYGYEAVNVESQSRSPESLLNWTKRLITLRNRYQAFGRGTQRFLFPGNRKVLAYLREYEDTVLLCVFNLSRAAQAVELDLSEFHRHVPVELFGQSVFPTINENYYPLTLAEYGWFWFLLTDSEKVSGGQAVLADSAIPELITVVVRNDWTEVTNEIQRRDLAKNAAPGFLYRQRWFAGKDVKIKAVDLTGPVVNAEGASYWMASVEVEHQRTKRQTYFLPLACRPESELHAAGISPQQVLAQVRRGGHLGILYDAMADEAFVKLALRAMAEEAEYSGVGGSEIKYKFYATGAMTVEDWQVADFRRFGGEQSNSSIVLGNRVILKLFRRVESGINPDLEIGRYLTACGFAHSPQVLGWMEKAEAEKPSITLAIAQRYLTNQGDGWTFAVEYLQRELERVALGSEDQDERHESWYSHWQVLASTLGQRTAELHRALAQDSEDPAFIPEVIDDRDIKAWRNDSEKLLRRATVLMERHRDVLPVGFSNEVASVREIEKFCSAQIRSLNRTDALGLKTRVHGDYHLGQVLIHEHDWYILDFEGEPELPLRRRREKQSPIKDVAGMLRSFDYAAATAIQSENGEAASTYRYLASQWRDAVSAEFISAYRMHAAGSPGCPQDDESFFRLLNFFLVQKALYEVVYEAANRPSWLPIPVEGLLKLAQAST